MCGFKINLPLPFPTLKCEFSGSNNFYETKTEDWFSDLTSCMIKCFLP